ncbi:LuxR C-terminal-related transcriptional regulator [Agromyces sp. NPDC057679]|uniref:LuxR C-terminal-related transcriptional regulator n=1 Tax=Agromyces sp. NPDC057679 TaxID=3346207 RepID=UPI003672B64A
MGGAALDVGRAAYRENRWNEAVAELELADRETVTTPLDLEHLATAAFLVGRAAEGLDWLARAHEAFLADGDDVAAIRCAAWLGMMLSNVGDHARSSGWFARAERLVDDAEEPDADHGFLRVPRGLQALYSGDAEGAEQIFREAERCARQAGDADIAALAGLGIGQSRIMLGELGAGMRLLDEVMVAVTTGELSPEASGIAYCALLQSCRLAFDLRRAQEWTRALDRWCAERPDLIVFTGQCHAHRAALFLAHGAWAEAGAAAAEARRRSARGDHDGAYASAYLEGEVHRLRGEDAAAEAAYESAARTGFEPQPGLALLRLAQGEASTAQRMILAAADRLDPSERRALLPAIVEIQLGAGEVAGARGAADELIAFSRSETTPMVGALAESAESAVLLAEGDAAGALTASRRAWVKWRELEVPFEAARCRVLAARCYRASGDEASAVMELDAARAILDELGAAPVFAAVESLTKTPGGLSPREVEVLRLVAAGHSNREIGAELYLSEKTVERHLSNIFGKLGLASRSAATAYAFRHGLAE